MDSHNVVQRELDVHQWIVFGRIDSPRRQELDWLVVADLLQLLVEANKLLCCLSLWLGLCGEVGTGQEYQHQQHQTWETQTNHFVEIDSKKMTEILLGFEMISILQYECIQYLD